MQVFVKAKFPERVVDGVKVVPAEKKRTDDLESAYAFASLMFYRGAMSVTIRPERVSHDAN